MHRMANRFNTQRHWAHDKAYRQTHLCAAEHNPPRGRPVWGALNLRRNVADDALSHSRAVNRVRVRA